MDYSDLNFNNIQLEKLVSSAEIILTHLYKLVSIENRVFIDQWFCFKQEFDETCSRSSPIDVNDNLSDYPVLARIDEVSENERGTASTASRSDSTVDSISKVNDSFTPVEAKDVSHNSQLDTDLLDNITNFKLLADKSATENHKSESVNLSETQQCTKLLDNNDFQNSRSNMYSKELIGRVGINENEETRKQLLEKNMFIPINDDCGESVNSLESNRFDEYYHAQYNHQFAVHSDILDRHICYLQDMHRFLVLLRQKLDFKLKNTDEWKWSTDFLKIDVAFEIIDSAIEMKNQLKIGREIDDVRIHHPQVDAVVANCLHIMSPLEVRHLLFMFMNRVIEMRKCTLQHDNQVRELDQNVHANTMLVLYYKICQILANFLSEQKLMSFQREVSNLISLTWRLYQANKKSIEVPREDIEQRLLLMDKLTDDESMIRDRGRELLPILEKNSLQGSTNSESRDLQALVSYGPAIPEKSLRMLQSTATPLPNIKVERVKGKMKFKSQKL